MRLNKYYWTFEDDGKLTYASEPDYLYSISKPTKFKCQSNIEFHDLDGQDPEDLENDLTINLNFEVHKFNISIYSPYIIINQTDCDLCFGIKNSDLPLTLIKESCQYFNPMTSDQNQFCIKVDNYERSSVFKISTLGLAGIVTAYRNKKLIRDDEDNESMLKRYNSDCLSFGILVSSLSYPFARTTAVKIKPRYVLYNYCSEPIILTQDCKNATLQHWIKPDEHKIYQFEHKDDNDLEYVKIRHPQPDDYRSKGMIPLDEVDRMQWSDKFEIDEIEDFQVFLQSSVDDIKMQPGGPKIK